MAACAAGQPHGAASGAGKTGHDGCGSDALPPGPFPTLRRLLRFLFRGAMPCRVRALVLRTEPRRGRVSALAGFEPYRARPAGIGPVRRVLGGAVAAGPRIVVPDELPGEHHALDAAAVGEHGAEEVGRALAAAPEPDHAVADGGRGEFASAAMRPCPGGREYIRIPLASPKVEGYMSRHKSSWTNPTEDRVRYICSVDERIYLSTGDREDRWSLHETRSRGA